MTVRDCLNADALIVHSDTLIAHAWAVMRQHDVRHLPVLDRQNRLVGLVSQRDVRRAVSARPEAAAQRDLRNLMTLAPHVVRGDAALHEALTLLCGNGDLDALPVVTDGRFEGLVTRHELVSALTRAIGPRGAQAEIPATIWDRQAPDASVFLG